MSSGPAITPITVEDKNVFSECLEMMKNFWKLILSYIFVESETTSLLVDDTDTFVVLQSDSEATTVLCTVHDTEERVVEFTHNKVTNIIKKYEADLKEEIFLEKPSNMEFIIHTKIPDGYVFSGSSNILSTVKIIKTEHQYIDDE